jgi:hypothetical protein
MLFRLSMLVLVIGVAVCSPRPYAAAIPNGSGTLTPDLNGVALQLFTYRPDNCAITGILLVFHGQERDASDYRTHAIPLGQRLCMLVVAPLFDAEPFPFGAISVAGSSVMAPSSRLKTKRSLWCPASSRGSVRGRNDRISVTPCSAIPRADSSLIV